ncbi:MAG: flavin reductase family protein [Deltaproteobacteria bacterium]|nr:flavin reductase family protein [Deltaproteobacteria bacterium]
MVSEQEFKSALSQWATGVTVITCQPPGGQPMGFTATSFSSLSLNPPLVLFCLARGASVIKDFENAEGFAVNVLESGQQKLSNQFASGAADRFQGVDWSPGAHGQPVLAGALMSLQCRKAAMHPGGDHIIFVGEVLATQTAETAETAESSSGDPKSPLLYFNGNYHTL